MRKERLENLHLDVRGGSERQRYSDDRVLPDGLKFMSFMKILWFRRMKEMICNGDYFVMYTLFNFEPVKGFKWGVVRMCRGGGLG